MRSSWESHDKAKRQFFDSHYMVMRKYTTLLQLLSLSDMSVLVCLLDVLTLTSGWPQDHDLPFRQKAMVKTWFL